MVSSDPIFACLNFTSPIIQDLHCHSINTTSTATALEQLTKICTPQTAHAINNEDEQFISNELRKFFEVMNFVILSGVISFTGGITNIINIIVFMKQGFRDPVNISLLALSVSDLGALVTLVWMSICFNPLFANSSIGFDSTRVQYLTAGWPHVCCARITSWITAFVTFERCLCIAMPLKVKTIITPKRTACAMIGIFLALIISVCPVYYAISIGQVHDLATNQTVISLVYRPNGPEIENVSFAINSFAQLSSLVLVIVCTIILVQSLHRKSKWRKASTTTDSTTQRDKRLIKMIISLSTIFIVCYLPSAVNIIVMILTPGYSIIGKHSNMFQVGWSFLNTLEAANSSVNIIVYYKMSTRYRVFLKRLFSIRHDMQNNGQQGPTTVLEHSSYS